MVVFVFEIRRTCQHSQFSRTLKTSNYPKLGVGKLLSSLWNYTLRNIELCSTGSETAEWDFTHVSHRGWDGSHQWGQQPTHEWWFNSRLESYFDQQCRSTIQYTAHCTLRIARFYSKISIYRSWNWLSVKRLYPARKWLTHTWAIVSFFLLLFN